MRVRVPLSAPNKAGLSFLNVKDNPACFFKDFFRKIHEQTGELEAGMDEFDAQTVKQRLESMRIAANGILKPELAQSKLDSFFHLIARADVI